MESKKLKVDLGKLKFSISAHQFSIVHKACIPRHFQVSITNHKRTQVPVLFAIVSAASRKGVLETPSLSLHCISIASHKRT